ncbi:halocyanin domain-containing protein [Halobaculum sp. WSA2]|uniref:Halocyanin domain-containing protein n=1 Tax=Halobaculum saliterrae TaxID=2073113 RepID=A0A6B0SSH8_9EURY|nr:halocyanin domain-containing protein [Halobaculum saliterrae]MXR40546.1 halocyanin domain-containing protein [Halobaculum saliterrae]
MTTTPSTPTIGRRRFIQASAAVAVGGAALSTPHPVSAQSDTDFEAWFGNVSNYDGVVDKRGMNTVTVTVGAPGNGGGFAFGPAAVRVDPGTTVVWEWTGEGGMHNVAATDGAYESALSSDAGDTFERTFDAEGISRYVCTPHEPMGMKGAVVVGDIEVGAETAAPEFVSREPDYDGWFDGVGAFDGTVDMRGREEVRIGVTTDDDAPGFSPAAVHVDPGTRVIWEWSGHVEHRLSAEDGAYESPEQATGTWGLVFDGTGISKYASSADGATMRGAVVVGDVFGSVHEISTAQLTVAGGVGLALVSPLAFGAFLWSRGREHPPNADAALEREPVDALQSKPRM